MQRIHVDKCVMHQLSTTCLCIPYVIRILLQWSIVLEELLSQGKRPRSYWNQLAALYYISSLVLHHDFQCGLAFCIFDLISLLICILDPGAYTLYIQDAPTLVPPKKLYITRFHIWQGPMRAVPYQASSYCSSLQPFRVYIAVYYRLSLWSIRKQQRKGPHSNYIYYANTMECSNWYTKGSGSIYLEKAKVNLT